MASRTSWRARSKSLSQKDAGDNKHREVLMYGPAVPKQPYVYTQLVRDEVDDNNHPQRRLARVESAQQLTQRNTWPTEAPKSTSIKPNKPSKPRYYSFDTVPTLTKTPWEAERHRRNSHAQYGRRPRQLPAHVFNQLPHEIYSCIVGHLEASYTKGCVIDVRGRQQALRTVCLTSKRWAKAAIEHLYRDLWLPSSAPGQKTGRRLSISGRRLSLSMGRPKSQLDLLLRTINEAPSLTFLVRRAHISSALARELDGESNLPSRTRSVYPVVQRVLDHCTEAELVSGYTPTATRDNTDYYSQLFGCERLHAHAWILDLHHPPAFSPSQFIDLHERWDWLQTLVLCKTDGYDTRIGPGMITAVTNRLWSLQHLMVSNFGRDDFHNGTLLSLRALRSLRLENLDGITDQGIHQLSHTRNAFSLESLSLINLELASLATIQTLLSNLTRLQRLRLVQGTSPNPTAGTSPTSRRNALSSATLRHLHWDTLISGPALDALAHSIEWSLFPSLRSIKAPSDPSGQLQALCRPIARSPLTASDMRFVESLDQDRYTRSLRLSRLQAQMRVRESRRRPSLCVVVSDEEEQTRHTTVIGSYLGDVRSAIEYSLEPDVEGEEEALATLGDVVRPRGVVEGGGERIRSFELLF
ncbi:hypothetical protein Q7P37_003545 [Cladosporium fusiforme]